MRFVCVICHADQPTDAGRRMDSGSWCCTDRDACFSRYLTDRVAEGRDNT